MVVIRSLEQVPFGDIMCCFQESFRNYFVKMPVDNSYYQARFKAALVSYSHSYGAFVGDRLVAFIIHGTDYRDNQQVMFNTGTGVLPIYRGRGLVKRMYQHALPYLIKIGVATVRLEVIKENLQAQRAYEKVGFRITQKYQCYQGNIKTLTPPSQLHEITASDINWQNVPNQEFQSWDHHANSLANGNYKFYHVKKDGRALGFFVLNPSLNYLAQAEVYQPMPSHWDILFSCVHTICPCIKINNIDERHIEKIAAINRAILKKTVGQFEMEMSIV